MEVECFLARCLVPAPPSNLRHSLIPNSKQTKNKNGSLKVTAKIDHHEEDGHENPFIQSAVSRASYRFHQTLRPEPLFVDPYAACFAPHNLEFDANLEQKLHRYCIGTRFIDDQLLSVIKGIDGSKQVVLFTDGMDTRAYRLNWPSSTVIYDVSSQAIFSEAFQKLQDVGAKIPRSCLLKHVPLESSDMQQGLRDKGFNGSRPSVWAFQGFPVANLAGFKEILLIVSNLAMKGSLFLGEFPISLMENKLGIKPETEWMDELFMSYGFRVGLIVYDDVSRNLGQGQAVGVPDNLLFVAEHLRFSDDQMESWRREFQRIEEEGDEEGFEEL